VFLRLFGFRGVEIFLARTALPRGCRAPLPCRAGAERRCREDSPSRRRGLEPRPTPPPPPGVRSLFAMPSQRTQWPVQRPSEVIFLANRRQSV